MTQDIDHEQEFDRRLGEAEEALRKAYGGKPGTFAAALKRAGRRLPRRARTAGQEVLAAQQLAGHPKLRQQLDWAKVNKAIDRIMAAAGSVDRAEQRKGRLIGVAASLAFNLILLFVLLVVFARWQGWV